MSCLNNIILCCNYEKHIKKLGVHGIHKDVHLNSIVTVVGESDPRTHDPDLLEDQSNLSSKMPKVDMAAQLKEKAIDRQTEDFTKKKGMPTKEHAMANLQATAISLNTPEDFKASLRKAGVPDVSLPVVEGKVQPSYAGEIVELKELDVNEHKERPKKSTSSASVAAADDGLSPEDKALMQKTMGISEKTAASMGDTIKDTLKDVAAKVTSARVIPKTESTKLSSTLSRRGAMRK